MSVCKTVRLASSISSTRRFVATASPAKAASSSRPSPSRAPTKWPLPSPKIFRAEQASNLFDINRIIGKPRAWDAASISKMNLKFELREASKRELIDCVKYLASRGVAVSDVDVQPSQLPSLTEDMVDMEQQFLIDGPAFAILDPIAGLDSVFERCMAAFIQTSVMGKPVAQNQEGLRAILVYDRDPSRKMRDGARYHQSHEGGSIHSDNVNTEELWDYLLLSCLRPAQLGGESIFLSTLAVHDFMVANAPRALEILRKDYLWECRGFESDNYSCPIVQYNDRKEPVIRYLRPYIESAYHASKTPISRDQIWAMDVLDACCELSALQLRISLSAGQTIVMNDLQLLHGRTSFVDPPTTDPKTVDPMTATTRLYQRTWLKKSN